MLKKVANNISDNLNSGKSTSENPIPTTIYQPATMTRNLYIASFPFLDASRANDLTRRRSKLIYWIRRHGSDALLDQLATNLY